MSWPHVALREVLRLNPAAIALDEHTTYKQAALYPQPRGMTLRAVKPGLDFPLKRQKLLQTGQFMISKRRARQKLWGIVPSELDGAVIALGSLLFDIQPPLVVDYFGAYISTVLFRQKVFSACSQRDYLNVRQFTDILIPLPPFDGQHRVAELWKAADAILTHTREMYASIAALKSGVARDLFGAINSSWEVRKLEDYAWIGQEQTGSYSLIVLPPDQIILGAALFGESGVGIQPNFEVESLYLYYYLENQKSDLLSGTVAEIESRLRSLTFPVPTLYEQRKIVLAMQQYDEALLRIRAEQTGLRKLIDALFHSIFSGTLDLRDALPILQRLSTADTDGVN